MAFDLLNMESVGELSLRWLCQTVLSSSKRHDDDGEFVYEDEDFEFSAEFDTTLILEAEELFYENRFLPSPSSKQACCNKADLTLITLADCFEKDKQQQICEQQICEQKKRRVWRPFFGLRKFLKRSKSASEVENKPICRNVDPWLGRSASESKACLRKKRSPISAHAPVHLIHVGMCIPFFQYRSATVRR